MFTGIINYLGIFKNALASPNHDLLITIRLEDKNLSAMAIGCSIAANGACLTLVSKEKRDNYYYLNFQVSEETLSKTTISDWKKGDKVNIEFSLKAGDEISGHYVLGHIDTTTKITAIQKINDSHQFAFAMPSKLAPLICQKGAVAIDGISLTVNEVSDDIFLINIIPHTYQHTNLQYLKSGDKVNLEVDMFARYLIRYNSFKKYE